MNTFINRENIKIVFLDWFGVVSTKFYWCEQSSKSDLLKDWCNAIFDNNDLLNEWMRGKYDLKALSALHNTISHEQLTELFIQDMHYYIPDMVLLRSVNSLFPKAQKMLITDNMSVFSELIVDKYHLNDYFEKLYVSSDIGVLKKDSPKSLFHHVLKDLNLADFSDCVLIDDDSENCKIFRSQGGRTIHVS